MTAKAPPPKAEFFITLSWISGSVEEKVENEQIRIYKLNQSWVITEANILLDNGIEGGHIDFSWLVVHVKQTDVAHGSGQFEITLIDGTVLVTGAATMKATDFTKGEERYMETKLTGHGLVNIWARYEGTGLGTVITVEGYYWQNSGQSI